MSDDSNVATVDQTGLVTAVGTGNCRITAYDNNDGYLKSSLDIAVEAENTNSDVLFIWGESDATMVEVGDTLRLFVSKNGESYSDVTYLIDSTDYAEISEDGVLTGKAEGTVLVTVIDKADTSVATSKSFEVVAEIAVESIFVHGAADVNTITEPGGQLQIVAQASPSDELYTDVTFSVNDETIATIDSTSGWLTAVGNGTVVVTGTSTVDNSLTDTCEIVISGQTDDSGETDVEFSLAGAGGLKYVLVNESLQLEVLKDYLEYTDVTYSVDNDQIATVNDTGLLTGVSEGQVNVTVVDKTNSSLTATKTFDVVITKPALVLSAINGETELHPGGTENFECKDPYGEFYGGFGEVEWSVSDDTLATITTSGNLTISDSATAGKVTVIAKDTTGKYADGTYEMTIVEW